MARTIVFRSAKEKKLRLWKDYQPAAPTVAIKEKNYTAKVFMYIFTHYKN